MKQEPYEIKLSACPFCRNTEKLGVRSATTRRIWNVAENDCIYEKDCIYWVRFSVRCPRCHARGPVVSGIVGYDAPRTISYDGQQEEVQTREHYAILARKAWNRRAQEGEKQE